MKSVSELKERICGSLGEECKNCGHSLGDHDNTGCNWKRHGALRACDCPGFEEDGGE